MSDNIERLFAAGIPLTEINRQVEAGVSIDVMISKLEPEQALTVNIGSDMSLLQMKLAQMRPEESYTLDDKGFGALFADVFVDLCRWNVTAKEWYFYDGSVWAADVGGMRASQQAKRLVEALTVYSTTMEDYRKAEYLKMVARYGQLKYRETMMKDARDKHFICQADLDANHDLLNCQNGTFNLRTGVLQPHCPGDLLSKVASFSYDPDATSPLFTSFMDQVMERDSEKINYLQKVIGYSLTAETTVEACWILFGSTTRNGKSTLVETISHMLGGSSGYSCTMQPQTLAQKQNKDTRQASGDIARLNDCRFLSASEPPKRMLFDAALLKTLLGRDTITARHLFEREFEFRPHFKLFINTNFLPLIQDDTLFTSGRINVITFDRHFAPHEQDRTLKDKLRTPENLSGIFNWCYQGLLKFRAEGANPPEAVKAATAEYRQSSDKIGNFISECLERTGKNSKAGDVYRRFSSWCLDNGFGVESKSNFFDELKAKGLFMRTGTVNGATYQNVVPMYEIIGDVEIDPF